MRDYLKKIADKLIFDARLQRRSRNTEHKKTLGILQPSVFYLTDFHQLFKN